MTEDEEGTFQEIDRDDEEVLGPPAVLICGYPRDIDAKLRRLLESIGAGDHRLVFCTPTMVKQTLGAVLEGTATDQPAAPDQLPRVMILSGFTGAQIHGFLDGYPETELPRPILATVTRINLGFPIGGLLSELVAEQRAMKENG